MSKLSVTNVGISGDIVELSSRMGGSRYSKITSGFGADDEDDLTAYVDNRFDNIHKLKYLNY